MANLSVLEPTSSCHVVVMPYPGRGHINPIMNLCKLIASRRADILINFILTEEWLGFIGSDPKPANIRFRTIPNIIPSELVRGVDFPGFIEATLTKLQGPVERLLDGLETPASVIVYDVHLTWVVGVGNRRNIPVASFWPMSATVFSMLHHYELFVQNGHTQVNLSEQGEELVNYVPGVPSTRVADLPTPFYGKGHEVLPRVLEAISWIPRAQYLLFPSIYELEARVIDVLKAKFPIPIYSIGPAIPYFKLEDNILHQNDCDHEVTRWLDNQPKSSVLYISQGSFLSVSSAQLDEIVGGVKSSGVRYLWIARGEASRFKEGGNGGGKGLVVPWCDQLRVLCHSSIGGFWSHCGWNSTKEAAFSGVPVLTFPIFWDQVPDSKMIVEDWKTGRRAMRRESTNTLITKEEIAELIKKFMDLESDEGKEMRKRAQEIKEISRQATAKGGSAEMGINAFISDISGCRN